MIGLFMSCKEAARTRHSLGMFATGAIFCRTVARATHLDALVPQVFQGSQVKAASTEAASASTSSQSSPLQRINSSRSAWYKILRPGNSRQGNRSVSSSAARHQLQPDSWALLQSRAIIQVKGPDCIKFLQGLTTNDMLQLSSPSSRGRAVACAFLNPQGRVMYDALVCRGGEEVLFLDVARAQVLDMLAALTRYKLRAKVTIEERTDAFSVCVALGPSAGKWWVGLSQSDESGGASGHDSLLVFQDPRHIDLGVRALMPTAEADTYHADKTGWLRVSEEAYDLYRLSRGVAQGPLELASGACTPLECNLELFGAVSFAKGCYVGQELTARTHFRGQVRKRLVPFVLAVPAAAHEVLAAEETRKSENPGEEKIKSGDVTLNEMLACMRREDPSVTEDEVQRHFTATQKQAQLVSEAIGMGVKSNIVAGMCISMRQQCAASSRTRTAATALKAGDVISVANKPVGKVVAFHMGVGLAMIRLEYFVKEYEEYEEGEPEGGMSRSGDAGAGLPLHRVTIATNQVTGVLLRPVWWDVVMQRLKRQPAPPASNEEE